MQLDFANGSRRLAAVAALLSLGACATTGGAPATAPSGAAEAQAAGLRGPIEARGPATASEPEETKAAAAPAPPVRFLDRERDRWYYYDEQRQIYRWDNGEPKR
jgi:hypothetical protein